MSTWILLRGLTRERRHWGEFPDLMAAAFPESKVLALELPGNGERLAEASPWRISGMMAQVRRELDDRGLKPPFMLLAMSMGAMVATTWATEHPDDIKGCVLINTSFGRFSPLHQRLRPRAWWKLLMAGMSGSPHQREQRIWELTTRLVPESSGIVDQWAAIRTTRPVSLGNALRQLVAAAGFRAPAVAPAPTLLLVGAADGLVHPKCSLTIAQAWQCGLAIHPEAGHDLPLDDGPWVVERVREWLMNGQESQALPAPDAET